MEFEAEWHDSAANAAPEERATVADLRIFVDGQNVCEHFLEEDCAGGHAASGHEAIERVAVSVYPLAEEIALRWWSLFGARDAELRLVDGRCGYLIPDVRLKFDGSDLNVVCLPHRYENPPVWFFRNAIERLTKGDAECALSGFIAEVVERLDTGQVEECALQLRWERIRRSRADAEEAAFCEAAGALDLDPYDLSDADASFMEEVGAFFTGEPLIELLSGLRGPRSTPGRPPTETLDWIRAAESRSRHKSRLPVVEGLREDLADCRATRRGERPWARGYRCARAARRALNIGPAEGFSSAGALADRLGAPSFSTAGFVPGIHAVVQSTDDSLRVHLRTPGSKHAHTRQLFALGRAVGDALSNPPAERSAVNGLHGASRQAVGRAFSAEFLAPVEEIVSMHEDRLDTGTIADKFGVSDEVIERQIENEERIMAACAASPYTARASRAPSPAAHRGGRPDLRPVPGSAARGSGGPGSRAARRSGRDPGDSEFLEARIAVVEQHAAGLSGEPGASAAEPAPAASPDGRRHSARASLLPARALTAPFGSPAAGDPQFQRGCASDRRGM